MHIFNCQYCLLLGCINEFGYFRISQLDTPYFKYTAGKRQSQDRKLVTEGKLKIAIKDAYARELSQAYSAVIIDPSAEFGVNVTKQASRSAGGVVNLEDVITVKGPVKIISLKSKAASDSQNTGVELIQRITPGQSPDIGKQGRADLVTSDNNTLVIAEIYTQDSVCDFSIYTRENKESEKVFMLKVSQPMLDAPVDLKVVESGSRSVVLFMAMPAISATQRCLHALVINTADKSSISSEFPTILGSRTTGIVPLGGAEVAVYTRDQAVLLRLDKLDKSISKSFYWPAWHDADKPFQVLIGLDGDSLQVVGQAQHRVSLKTARLNHLAKTQWEEPRDLGCPTDLDVTKIVFGKASVGEISCAVETSSPYLYFAWVVKSMTACLPNLKLSQTAIHDIAATEKFLVAAMRSTESALKECYIGIWPFHYN